MKRKSRLWKADRKKTISISNNLFKNSDDRGLQNIKWIYHTNYIRNLQLISHKSLNSVSYDLEAICCMSFLANTLTDIWLVAFVRDFKTTIKSWKCNSPTSRFCQNFTQLWAFYYSLSDKLQTFKKGCRTELVIKKENLIGPLTYLFALVIVI